MDLSLPEGTAHKIQLQRMILSVNDQRAVEHHAARCRGLLTRTGKQLHAVRAHGVCRGDHILDLNCAIALGKALLVRQSIIQIRVRILSKGCQLGSLLLLVVFHSHVMLVHKRKLAVLPGEINIGHIQRNVGQPGGYIILLQGLVIRKVLLCRKGGADLLGRARGEQVAVFQGLIGNQFHSIIRGYVVGGVCLGIHGAVIFIPACLEAVYARHVKSNAEVIVRIDPSAPRFGIVLAHEVGAIAHVPGVSPEHQVVTRRKCVTRPGLGAVIPNKGIQIADRIQSGQLLPRIGVLPAREVHEAVVYADKILLQGIGVFHIAGCDIPDLAPVHGLCLDIHVVFAYLHVNQAACHVASVTALYGVVGPLIRVVKAAPFKHALDRARAVIGLLDQTPRVMLVDQVGQVLLLVRHILQIIDGAAPSHIHAKLEAPVVDIVGGGVGGVKIYGNGLGFHAIQRKFSRFALAGLDADAADLLTALLPEVLVHQRGEYALALLQIKVLGQRLSPFVVVGHEHMQGCGRAVGQ